MSWQSEPSGAPSVGDPRLRWFASDEGRDTLMPSGALALAADEVSGNERRCPGASEDELTGLLRAFAAVESWAAGAKLGVIAEMIRRDPGPRRGAGRRHGDLPDEWSPSLRHELALALACSTQSAETTIWLAWELQARLKGTAADIRVACRQHDDVADIDAAAAEADARAPRSAPRNLDEDKPDDNDEPDEPEPGDDPGGPGPSGPGASPPLSGRTLQSKPPQDLVVPLLTLLGLAERPGEVQGFGLLDPALASVAGRNSPWAFRRRDSTGPPGRADPPDGYGTWVLTLPGGRRFTVRLAIVPTFYCDHRYETHGYQPSGRLRHLVQVRDGTCTFPSCNRRARQSDFEHAVPYDNGGRTCCCNAGARSRACHRVKQSSGWEVTQPQPGWHQWRTPSGRRYGQEPKRYAA